MSQSTTGPRRTTAADRRRQAMQLRTQGLSFQRIGDALGISRQSAHKHVQRALAELARETEQAVRELRALESERLDRALAVIWPQVEAGHLGAIDRMLRIGERRARLLGLDAPTRIAPTDPSGTAEYSSPRGMAALLASLQDEPPSA